MTLTADAATPGLKVLLYADFRSPHARGWCDGLRGAGIEVLAVSSEAVVDEDVVGPSGVISAIREKYVQGDGQNRSWFRTFVRKLSGVQFTHSVIQLTRMRSRRGDLRRAIDGFKPDLVHALRLPYEGITALSLGTTVPVVVSSWGQDFVPQASTDPILRHWMRKYVRRAAGFQYDSPDDLLHAKQYGLPSTVPTLHAAGNFGVDELLYHNSDPKVPGLVVYARRASANCNYFGFIEAALQLIETTSATFVGVGLRKLEAEVGELDSDEFAELVRSAPVIVSPSYTDGMPVSILGAVASSARIVAGSLPQLKELADRGADIELIDARESREIEAAISRQISSTRPAPSTELPDEYSRSSNTARVPRFYQAVLSTSASMMIDELSDWT
jgi:hypothetical protein